MGQRNRKEYIINIGLYNWDKEDKEYIEENALQMIEEKLLTKYSDVICSEQEIIKKLKDLINEMI